MYKLLFVISVFLTACKTENSHENKELYNVITDSVDYIISKTAIDSFDCYNLINYKNVEHSHDTVSYPNVFVLRNSHFEFKIFIKHLNTQKIYFNREFSLKDTLLNASILCAIDAENEVFEKILINNPMVFKNIISLSKNDDFRFIKNIFEVQRENIDSTIRQYFSSKYVNELEFYDDIKYDKLLENENNLRLKRLIYNLLGDVLKKTNHKLYYSQGAYYYITLEKIHIYKMSNSYEINIFMI